MLKNKIFLIGLLMTTVNLFLGNLGAKAEEEEHIFTINNGSNNYSATISVEKCADGNCEGKGTVKLTNKKTKKPFQTLTSKNLFFFLNENQKPTVNVIELYNEQSPLIFGDFNFDGTEDLAVRNGNDSAYGGPSYDVYVYNQTKKQLVLSKELTKLVVENLGMFQIDKKRQRLITFTKSGCCWHLTTEYSVIPKKGLVKVFELEEDAQTLDFVTVTTRNLVKNKWVNKVEKFKAKEYYKN